MKNVIVAKDNFVLYGLLRKLGKADVAEYPRVLKDARRQSLADRASVPAKARRWIRENSRLIEASQTGTPAEAALLMEKFASEYYKEFKRELSVDMERLYGRA